MSMFISAILCLLVLIHAHAAFTLISASSVPESPPVIMRGICQLVGENISGTVLLQQLSNGGPTSIVAAISGLTPGKHGFHVHEYGDLRDSCKACGRHFNPFSLTHGHPDDAMRHVGDLNNAFANANGNAMVDMTDIQVSLVGPESVYGRSIVVHAGEDDLGRGGDDESSRTGNAGPRVACCVIGRASAVIVESIRMPSSADS